MNTNDTPAGQPINPASSAALRVALDGVSHAVNTALAMGLAVLAEASGGRVQQLHGRPGPRNGAVNSPVGTAKILPDSKGDRVELKIRVSPEAYAEIRAHLAEECWHDHDDCGCELDAWPAWEDLPLDCETNVLHLDGEPRGTATRHQRGLEASLRLNDEDVFKAAGALRLASSFR